MNNLYLPFVNRHWHHNISIQWTAHADGHTAFRVARSLEDTDGYAYFDTVKDWEVLA